MKNANEYDDKLTCILFIKCVPATRLLNIHRNRTCLAHNSTPSTLFYIYSNQNIGVGSVRRLLGIRYSLLL